MPKSTSKFNFNFFESTFFALQGIFLGIGINDAWRLLKLPGTKEPFTMLPLLGEIDKDEAYQYALDAAVMASGLLVPLFGKATNNALLGAGMSIGTRWANMSERGSSLSVLDAPKNQQKEAKAMMARRMTT